MDKQLACYCGFPRCRGVVNDIEAEEQAAKIRVPRCDLAQWKGEWGFSTRKPYMFFLLSFLFVFNFSWLLLNLDV